MRYRFWLLCMVFGLFLPPSAMSTCGVPQPRLVCAEYFANQLVVESTLIRTDQDSPSYPSFYVYTMLVNQVLRGKIS
jgi:hypothetical protein